MAAPKRKPASKTTKTSKPSGAKPSGARLLIVEARFYNDISDALLAGAIGATRMSSGLTPERAATSRT